MNRSYAIFNLYQLVCVSLPHRWGTPVRHSGEALQFRWTDTTNSPGYQPHTTCPRGISTVIMSVTKCPRSPCSRIFFTSTIGALPFAALAILSAGDVFLQTVNTEEHVTVPSCKKADRRRLQVRQYVFGMQYGAWVKLASSQFSK